MLSDVNALAELQQLIANVQRQNARLKIIAVAIAGLSVTLAVVVIGVVFTASDLRHRDLNNLAEARKIGRIAAAEGDLRGCRANEEQDNVLAGLLEIALSLPRRPGTPTTAREPFQRVVDQAYRGRDCHRQPLLQSLPKADRDRLLRAYPRMRRTRPT